MLRSFFRRTIILLLFVISALAWVHIQFWGGAVRDRVDISLSGSLLSEVGGRRAIDSLLLPHLKHILAFNIYADHINLFERGVKAGYYEFTSDMDVVQIARALKLGVQTPVDVIFNNVRTLEQLAGRVSKQIEADSVELLSAMRSESLAAEFGLKPAEMISIFIPNTYEVWWTISPEAFVRKMYGEYRRFWSEERDAKRKVLNLTRTDVSTLASIVYEESSKRDEYSRIAGVYINRLRRGMKLQADPTVKYAIGDFGLKRILNRHLSYDSPYNTYMYKGVPPAPICLPSIAAMDGVLNYEHHSYLYFCARSQMDGYHNFESSYSEHLKNARLYSAELDKMGF